MGGSVVAMGSPLKDSKDRLGADCHGENLYMILLRISINLMANHQSIYLY